MGSSHAPGATDASEIFNEMGLWYIGWDYSVDSPLGTACVRVERVTVCDNASPSVTAGLCRVSKYLWLILSVLLTFKALWQQYEPSALRISNATFCIYVFHMILSVNGDYFLKQR
jgi:hypothetical protein